jgi:predicted outer membrane lipoprotein
MVCYAVPLVAALIHSGMRKKVTSWKHSTHHLWLGLLLAGGALFGVVDHLWNGELFLVGDNIVLDLMLGLTITVVIFAAWGIIVALDKIAAKKTVKTSQ